MTLKRRIFVANTGMVLFSLLILLGIGSILIDIFKGEFLNVLGQNTTLADHTYEVSTELLEIDSYQENWDKLSEKVAGYGYELYVSDGQGKNVFSNIRHSEMECIEQLEKMETETDKVLLTNMEGVTVVRIHATENQSKWNVYACYYNGEDSFLGMDRGMFEMFIIVFMVAGILTVVGLVFISQMITVRLTKKILSPVNELTKAAKRIDAGNFDEKISYTNEDEFYTVCATFDEMQLHLKEGIEKTAAYERARTEMVSGISHDLRTPLTSMKGFLKGIIDGVANTPEKQEQYIKISYQKTCDMEQLLQKLFFFSKLETGNMPFFKKRTELTQWIYTYLKEKKPELNEKKVEIEFESKDNQVEIELDTEQMRRVFDNLIENSLKYADTENLKMRICVEKDQKKARISISDNGNGIKDDKLTHIFEQFYRGDESRNSKNEGSGLGLYVCKYIVEQHDGKIYAYNDCGLTIVIELPVSIQN
ncbi:MAG: HAMP domain-containing sensor histidine kinase [Lachnospiraceae bacterium]|nr:HAMP domain-containing sensor histidine kinase [Lachnospiraceae bacterium]